jgi:hypothetical protein
MIFLDYRRMRSSIFIIRGEGGGGGYMDLNNWDMNVDNGCISEEDSAGNNREISSCVIYFGKVPMGKVILLRNHPQDFSHIRLAFA